jgi:acetyl esterase/lipase
MGCKTMPIGAYLQSPWVDLSHSLPSITSNQDYDYLPPLRVVDKKKGNRLHYYAPDNLLRNPYVSPLYADLDNLPPLFIQVGLAEKLYDEDILFAGKAAASKNSRVQVEVYIAHVHVFQIFARFNKGADQAMKRAGLWIRGVTEGKVNNVFRFISTHTVLDFDGNVVSQVPPTFVSTVHSLAKF